jgi:hypothetical protein
VWKKPSPTFGSFTGPGGQFFKKDVESQEIELFRKHERTRRPLEDDSFIETLGMLLDRNLKLQKPGSKMRDTSGVPGISPEFPRIPVGREEKF